MRIPVLCAVAAYALLSMPVVAQQSDGPRQIKSMEDFSFQEKRAGCKNPQLWYSPAKAELSCDSKERFELFYEISSKLQTSCVQKSSAYVCTITKS